MAEQEKIIEHLDAVFRDMESRLNGRAGSRLHSFHKASFEALRVTHFPDRKHEDWRYTPVQRLISPKYKLAENKQQYSIPEIPALDSYKIPVINGKVILEDIDPGLKSAGVIVRPLQEAMQLSSYEYIATRWLHPAMTSSKQAFELLNFAFHSGGFVIEIPKNLMLSKPVEIQIVHDDPAISFSHPLYFIHAAEGSSVTVIERFEKNISSPDTTANGLINALAFIHLDKNAGVKHIRWQDLPETQSLVYKLAVSQNRDSRFESFAFDFGGDLIRNNIDVELDESNTYTSLQAGYLAKRRQSFDHQTRINHKMPHCESHELYKGIIDEQASGAFNGKVYVHPDAQKTNAYQQNDSLVLSSNALMNSKPQLEIYADDVKCSHGATIGQLDEKSLFYLKARGIDPQTARHMLKAAFLAQVLDSTPVEPLRNFIRSRMALEA
ncbi:MAG: Fe-S cluster assembly protein SufD [Saprospiraceae bacterium]|nr:Fe-S cluster assembly protein SufD [Saprospiraceae bacterium]